LVHLLSCPEHEREQGSVASLEPLNELGIQYIQHINPPYEGEFPIHDLLPEAHRKSSSFGCFSAHKKAFMEEFSDDVDLLLICEGDCVLRVSHKRFLDAVIRFGAMMCSKNIICMSIGGFGYDEKGNDSVEGIYLSQIITGCQCMLFSKEGEKIMRNMFETLPWCAYDIWLGWALGRKNLLAVSERRLTTQIPGPSLLGSYQPEIPERSGMAALPKEKGQL